MNHGQSPESPSEDRLKAKPSARFSGFQFPVQAKRSFWGFLIASTLVCAVFWQPLTAMLQYALNDELYSHVLLVPVISVYFIYIQRQTFFSQITSAPIPGVLLLLVGIGFGQVAFLRDLRGGYLTADDYLSVAMLSFVCSIWGVCLIFFGRACLRSAFTPALFLLFLVPFPSEVTRFIEVFLQYGSADCAEWFFRCFGTTYYRGGLTFHLPNISVIVAEACSGIRSSLVLFMTGIIGATMFLSSPWRQVLVILATIPIGLLRNGFRVFAIGYLTSRVDPGIIDGPLHHHGGPVFFALSLIPLFLILIILRKSELKMESSKKTMRN